MTMTTMLMHNRIPVEAISVASAESFVFCSNYLPDRLDGPHVVLMLWSTVIDMSQAQF